jgi:hypothetical protein
MDSRGLGFEFFSFWEKERREGLVWGFPSQPRRLDEVEHAVRADGTGQTRPYQWSPPLDTSVGSESHTWIWYLRTVRSYAPVRPMPAKVTGSLDEFSKFGDWNRYRQTVLVDLPGPLSAEVTTSFDNYRQGTLFFGTGGLYGRTPPYRRPLKLMFHNNVSLLLLISNLVFFIESFYRTSKLSRIY